MKKRMLVVIGILCAICMLVGYVHVSESNTDLIFSKVGLSVFPQKTLSAHSTYRKLIQSRTDGRFEFHIYPLQREDVQFGLMDNENKAITIKVSKDGSLFYQQGEHWNQFTQSDVFQAKKWLRVSIDLAPERNANYARIFINGEQVGMAYYNDPFSEVNYLVCKANENFVFLKNIEVKASAGILESPEWESSEVATYLNKNLSGTVGFCEHDTDPGNTPLAGFGTSGTKVLDQNRMSFGVDLGEVVAVNGIRINNATPGDNYWQDFTVWISNDNNTWIQVAFTFNSEIRDGKRQAVFEFSGVEARYLKVNTTAETGALAVYDLQTDISAHRRIARQYPMAGQVMWLQGDKNPVSGTMTRIFRASTVHTLQFGDSIGFTFGIPSHVEAIELRGTGLADCTWEDLQLWSSMDNITYTPVPVVALSRDTQNETDILRLTFDSIKTTYLKIHVLKEQCSITLDPLGDGLRTYSSSEVISGFCEFLPNRGGEGDFYTLPDGTLVMGFNGFTSQTSGDFATGTLSRRTSQDGGYHWNDEQIVLLPQEGSINIMHSTYLWLDNGDLAIIYIEKENENESILSMRRSADNGNTWSAPIKITQSLKGYNILSSGNRLLRLPCGRILLPATYAPQVNDVYGGDRAVALVWYSDDEGTTWHRSTDFVTLPNAALEPSLALAADHTVVMSLRTRQEGKIYQTVSADNGLTWAQAKSVEGLVTPSSTNTVVTIPATGDIALFWNNEFATDNGQRKPLTMAVSSDRGAHWENQRNLIQGIYGTCWPVIKFHGRAVLCQYAGGGTQEGYYTCVQIIDIGELYHAAFSEKTVDDLPKAETPKTTYDKAAKTLYGTTSRMKYSLDNGNTWFFAGGSEVELFFEVNSMQCIWIQDIGTDCVGPSEIQVLNA